MFFDRRKLLIEEIKEGKRFFVEKLKDTVYLYITAIDFTITSRPMWLQNLSSAPYDYEIDRMEKGIPSRLPARYCKNVNGDKKAFNYTFKWAGNLLLVCGDGKVVAVITNPFDQPKSYHINAIGESEYANEMPQEMIDSITRI